MTQFFSRGYAVVVGGGADLPVTEIDARAVARILTDTGRCGYPPHQVQLLTGEGARRQSIRSSLDWLVASAGPEATAIVYFSGHGLETPDYHLMPFGYDLADLAGTALSGQEFTDRLRAIRAGKLLVLLDACHAGGQAEAKGVAKSPLPSSVLQTLAAGSGRVVLASSRRDELSWTGDPYSAFTGALLEALTGAGASEQDGYARVLDLALWVGRRVPETTGDRQHPIIKVSNLADNFAVAWYAGGAEEPLLLRQTVTRDKPRPEASQTATWQRMLNNYRENLLLIEERMSEYAEFTDIPLNLIKNKRRTADSIAELERKLGAG